MKRPNVLNLTCPAIPVVRIGFVGLGNRGILALERYMHLEGIEVKALCDLRKENIERAERILQESGRPKAENYSEEGKISHSPAPSTLAARNWFSGILLMALE